jgi:hypothetical protein
MRAKAKKAPGDLKEELAAMLDCCRRMKEPGPSADCRRKALAAFRAWSKTRSKPASTRRKK